MPEISIIGTGFVGGAMEKSFKIKGQTVYAYDKFKNIGSFEKCLEAPIFFLCLPTVFNENTNEYDKNSIHETCIKLVSARYKGLVVIKSTVEPETTNKLSEKYPSLKIVHNPEFLTAATAFDDFHNQKHIVLGKGPNVSDEDIKPLTTLYNILYPNALISICNSTESESMKIFVNCFYSVKVQFFNELYLTCCANNSDYNTVKNLMLKNNWINPMHTTVPGPDGQLSYGGYCFPKDTNALLQYMKNAKVPHEVLSATISERNKMRDDNVNIIKN
jgi:nucleotide sugar dehydrogenase